MKRIINALSKILVLPAMAAITLPAQTLTTLFSFDGTNGGMTYAGLIQATDGNFYGTMTGAGANASNACLITGCGTAFTITPAGTLTTLYQFCSQPDCTDGSAPFAELVQATDGDFYGTTEFGGANTNSYCYRGCGTVFRITSSGALTTLHSFCAEKACGDGGAPLGGLIQANNGDLYGTTYAGGARGGGTVFKITPGGELTTLHNFCLINGSCTDLPGPTGRLLQATDGDIYGTTSGDISAGTVFKITPAGKFTMLYSFTNGGGVNPQAGLIQATDGDFYGTTFNGGAEGCCHGTVFKITPAGTLTVLYNFCSETHCTDGANPWGGLVQATDGNLYGTTTVGGAKGDGTLFKITTSGTLTTLYNFCSQGDCTDGNEPWAGLVQGTDGSLYGTTQMGGAAINGCLSEMGCGTVFSLSVGLGPFVKTLPDAAEVGAAISIIGTDLTGASGVSFHGTPATFSVVSATEITAAVPAGATTGKIQVATPGGTLLSGGPFIVLP
jgi:uncharacterized repeat protein (TIGR03803 family)